jgi:hypothetical protein
MLLYSYSSDYSDFGCKGSANRAKYQIYLDISEMQPTFGEAKGTNKREENQKIFGFSRARVPSAEPEVV